MANRPPYPDTGDDTETGAGLDRGSTTSRPHRTPRWVKIFGIIALVLVLLGFCQDIHRWPWTSRSWSPLTVRRTPSIDRVQQP